MRDSIYQHLCTALLGFATLFKFIEYDIATFIVESLVLSAHIRDPDAIMKHAGYYGQAVKEIATCLATFIVPVVLNYVSPKWTLVIGSALFACYFACFFFITNVLYFLANILLGIAFALIYTSFSTCQMAFSTRSTLARNAARIQGIANLSLISGGFLYIYITATHSRTTENSDEQYRYYSESETKTMCGFLFAFCMINLVLTSCLPTREVIDSVASENPHQKLELGHQLKATISTLVNPYILLFVPRFLNHGLLVSFFMNVYPTSLQYSTILSRQYPMMTAYYAFAMCAGTTLCGIIVSPLNRYFHDFGLRPLYYITALVQFSLSQTYQRSVRQRNLLFSSLSIPVARLLWVCLTALLLGFVDSSNAASNSVICSRLLPGRASHTYSAARFYRGLAATAIFFAAPFLTMQSNAAIMITVTIISALSFDFAVKQIEKREDIQCSMRVKE